jgi:hypothetical protein
MTATPFTSSAVMWSCRMALVTHGEIRNKTGDDVVPLKRRSEQTSVANLTPRRLVDANSARRPWRTDWRRSKGRRILRSRPTSSRANQPDRLSIEQAIRPAIGDAPRCLVRWIRQFIWYGNIELAISLVSGMAPTKDLQDVSHDKHLRIEFSPFKMPPRTEPTPEDEARFHQQMEHDNCAFDKVEILPNNVGYVKFDGFMDASFCGPTVVAAMALWRTPMRSSSICGRTAAANRPWSP